MVWLRRWFVLAPSTKVEYDMRTSFYERLQRLPVAFHDRWQSGQLLSRMMQDISMLRRWMAFGIVLLVVNLLTILVGMALLFRWHWALGVTFLIVCAPLWYAGYRFEKTYGTLARQSQDQAGDLATSVEESVHGIRVLKAFGRGKHALVKFARQAETLRETELSKARAVGWIWFWLVLLPEIAFALCLGVGIVLQQPASSASPSSSRSSRWPPCCAGRWSRSASSSRSCWMPAPPATASSRCSTSRTRSPIPPRPSRWAHRAVRSRSRVCTSATRMPRRRADLLDGIDLTLVRARRWRSSDSPDRARRP
jgi:ABC-type multidrug transport system fused ATPase/permease subunit